MCKEAEMIAGVFMILLGVLIVAYPPLLSVLVASFFIFIGVSTMVASHYNRKLQKRYENPVVEFFFRF